MILGGDLIENIKRINEGIKVKKTYDIEKDLYVLELCL